MMSGLGPTVIIEDDEDDRQLLAEVFNSLQVPNELIFFKEGNAALEYLRGVTVKPFLIITDINLPGMSGLQLREEILKDAYLKKKSIPFIFLSTSDGKHILNKVYELQVQGYFQKADSMNAMKEQIEAIIAYWKLCKHPNN
jgi:CheY-like chemotaxis protein